MKAINDLELNYKKQITENNSSDELGEEAQKMFLGIPDGKVEVESESTSEKRQTNILFKNKDGEIASCLFHYL